MAEEAKLLTLDGKLMQVEKDLEPEVSLATGYSKGIYTLSYKDTDLNDAKCMGLEKCQKEADFLIMARIQRVIDAVGNILEIAKLDPEIADILKSTNWNIQLCYTHLFKSIVDENLPQQGILTNKLAKKSI